MTISFCVGDYSFARAIATWILTPSIWGSQMFFSEFLGGDSSHDRNNSHHPTTSRHPTRCCFCAGVLYCFLGSVMLFLLDVMLCIYIYIVYLVLCFNLCEKKSSLAILHSVMNAPLQEWEWGSNRPRTSTAEHRKTNAKSGWSWRTFGPLCARTETAFWTTFWLVFLGWNLLNTTPLAVLICTCLPVFFRCLGMAHDWQPGTSSWWSSIAGQPETDHP